MKGYVKYIGFAVIMAVLIAWFAGVFSRKEDTYQVQKQPKVVSGVEVGQVEASDTTLYSFVGNVVALRTAEVSTKIMGKITSINVKEGDFVSAGKALFSVDASDIQAQVRASEQGIVQAQQAYTAAKANLEAVEKTYKRYEQLLKEGAITEQEFDQIKAQYEGALAQLRQAQAGIDMARYQKEAVASNLRYATVYAPFSGYVTQKLADVGDFALPGKPVLILETPPYQFEVYLPERYLGKVNIGEVYQVSLESLGKIVRGKVVEVSPSLDALTRTFRVKLNLDDASVRSGMYGRLLVPENEKSIYVPTTAILKRFDFVGVYVVKEDGTIELRGVKLGEEKDGKVKVLSGLNGNEKIIVKGVEKACDGCKLGGQ